MELARRLRGAPPARCMQRHVLIDNSNVYWGLRKCGGEGGTPLGPEWRLRLSSVDRLLSFGAGGSAELDEAAAAMAGARLPDTVRVVAASEPPADAAIWSAWQRRGFEVVALPRKRIAGGGSHEKGVDEQLHAAGLTLATKFQDSNAPPFSAAIVLATGDGNDNGRRSDFPGLVRYY
jgi:hypothetical protein